MTDSNFSKEAVIMPNFQLLLLHQMLKIRSKALMANSFIQDHNPNILSTQGVHYQHSLKYDQKGRPLWNMEINKESPSPNSYYYKSNFKSLIEQSKNKPNKCQFGEPYEKFKRTCDIQSNIKVFDHSKYNVNATSHSPNQRIIKSRVPAYTIGAYEHDLFQEEIQRSQQVPAPDNYNVNDDNVKPQRYNNIGFGLDIKSTLKPIKYSPGPGDYNIDQLTSMNCKIQSRLRQHNFRQFLMNYQAKYNSRDIMHGSLQRGGENKALIQSQQIRYLFKKMPIINYHTQVDSRARSRLNDDISLGEVNIHNNNSSITIHNEEDDIKGRQSSDNCYNLWNGSTKLRAKSQQKGIKSSRIRQDNQEEILAQSQDYKTYLEEQNIKSNTEQKQQQQPEKTRFKQKKKNSSKNKAKSRERDATTPNHMLFI
ncbi:UNKNOWN [Stylonychia lemnae]|uniref:Uncharacterized protein n=1 Tax=Stylonychia lemnae TaxID=5949 RepID=A0A078AT66_STYLE|nr:UNKNOWN [Stylonychia lemnae]|eukprot:CDW85650.1 UNKNOWN [Stylonychia lemnae]